MKQAYDLNKLIIDLYSAQSDHKKSDNFRPFLQFQYKFLSLSMRLYYYPTTKLYL